MSSSSFLSRLLTFLPQFLSFSVRPSVCPSAARPELSAATDKYYVSFILSLRAYVLKRATYRVASPLQMEIASLILRNDVHQTLSGLMIIMQDVINPRIFSSASVFFDRCASEYISFIERRYVSYVV